MFEYYVKVLKNYATFTGRARRKEFWMFVLCNLIIAVGINILAIMAPAFSLLALLYSLAVLIPGLAVSVRRLHDIGKSGVWVLISFVPLIGGIWLIILLAQEGVQAENKWGPDPKAVE